MSRNTCCCVRSVYIQFPGFCSICTCYKAIYKSQKFSALQPKPNLLCTCNDFMYASYYRVNEWIIIIILCFFWNIFPKLDIILSNYTNAIINNPSYSYARMNPSEYLHKKCTVYAYQHNFMIEGQKFPKFAFIRKQKALWLIVVVDSHQHTIYSHKRLETTPIL